MSKKGRKKTINRRDVYKAPSYRRRNSARIEVTKYEVILSVGIVALMLILGVFISNKIYNIELDRKEMYTKAIRIDNNKEMFQYGIDTNVGNALVYGELKSVDTVSYPDIDGEYMYLKKVKEEYTRHTRVTTDSNGDKKTETYYEWDEVSTESIQSQRVTFCEITLDSNKIQIPVGDYISTVKKGFNTRYKYYGYPAVSDGTLFAKLNKDNLIGDKKAPFYSSLTLDQTYKVLMKDYATPLFWFIWLLVIIGVVWAFYYFDNDWLNKK